MSHQFGSILDLMQHRAAHQGNKVAYVFLSDGEQTGESITYQELEQRVRARAASIQARLKPGDRALLLYPPGLEYIVSFLGSLYAGVIPVPAYPPDNCNLCRLQSIAANAGATVALTTRNILLRMNIMEQIEDIEYVLRGGGQVTLGGYPGNLHRLHYLATDGIATAAGKLFQPARISPDDIAFLQYTSGSTNMPKGVMLTHHNLLYNCGQMQHYMRCTPESFGVSWLPPYHDMGLIGGILMPLYCGFPVTLMAPASFLKNPCRWLQAIANSKNKGKVISGAPDFAYHLCVNKINAEQVELLELSHWETAFSGAEPVRAETLTRFAAKFAPAGFKKKALLPVYGLAEGTLLASAAREPVLPVIRPFNSCLLSENLAQEYQPGSEGEPTLLVGCGQALEGQRIEIVNPDTLCPCQPGEIGEIWLAGPSIARGYWNNPEETRRAFHSYLADPVEGPFFRTGDLGFKQDGELFVTGRLKDLLVIGGRNYYPHDIEFTMAAAHPGLRAGGGIAITVQENGEERLVLVQEVERKFVRTGNKKEIIRAMVEAVLLQHGLQVHQVVLIRPASLPKTSSGKLQRQWCRKLLLAGELKAVFCWQAPVAALSLA